jgi:hypothetical protein
MEVRDAQWMGVVNSDWVMVVYAVARFHGASAYVGIPFAVTDLRNPPSSLRLSAARRFAVSPAAQFMEAGEVVPHACSLDASMSFVSTADPASLSAVTVTVFCTHETNDSRRMQHLSHAGPCVMEPGSRIT